MKNKFLKLFALLFATLLLFTLFSCGGYDDTLDADPFEQFNASIDEFAESFSVEDDENMLSSLLDTNFSVSDINFDESIDYWIDGISVKDGILYVEGAGVLGDDKFEGNNYAVQIFDTAAVVYELLGYGALETPIMLGSTTEGEKIDFEALKIKNEDLEEQKDKNTFSLKTAYKNRVGKLIESLGSAELAYFFKNTNIIVDTDKYEKYKEIEFTADPLTLTLSFEKLKGVQTLKFVLENDVYDSETELIIEMKKDEHLAIHLKSDAEQEINFDLSLTKVKSDIRKTKKYLLALDLEMFAAESTVVVNFDASAYEDSSGELSKLDADVNAEVQDEDILSASIKYDKASMKKAGKEGLVAELTLYNLDPKDLIKGGATLLSSKKEDNSYSLRLSVFTDNYSKKSSKYRFALELSENDEISESTAIINVPAVNVPELTDAEKKIIEDSKKLYTENAVELFEKVEYLNAEATKRLSSGRLNPEKDGYKIYTEDELTGFYYLTDITVENGQYQIDTRPAADYKLWLPIYAKNNGDFYSVTPSLASEELEAIIKQLEEFEESEEFTYSELNFKSFVYLEECGFYAILDGVSTQGATFTRDKPDLRHEIHKTENGYEVHEYKVQYNSDCRIQYTCKDCKTKKLTVAHHHDYEHVNSSPSGADCGKVLICKRCSDSIYELFDSENKKVLLHLIPATAVDLYDVETCEELGGYKLENLSTCLFIDDIICENDGQTAYVIEIPQIEGCEYRIIGVNTKFADGENLQKAELILPEGAELIMKEAFYGANPERIVLPDSTVYIGMGAFKTCCVSELVIEDARYIYSTAFESMSQLKEIVVDAKSLNYFPALHALNLEKIEFINAPKSFGGFSTCKITEYEIPEGVEKVLEFNRNKTLRKLVLPSTAKELHGLTWCDSLEELVLNNGLELIADHSVYGCDNLSRIWTKGYGDRVEEGIAIFPEGLKKIEEWSFFILKKIKAITFLSDGLSIESSTFGMCLLKSVRFEGDCNNIYLGGFPDVITYCGEINGAISFGKVTNIYAKTLRAVNIQYVSSDVAEINFAGTESEFLAAGYLLSSDETVVNCNVKFNEE
ncbi:MAG: hypothetical protein E7612_03745 [Ruminococcaceae bacterium]|nr:hypothetical protein [Oscillospiraceae bacterium]